MGEKIALKRKTSARKWVTLILVAIITACSNPSQGSGSDSKPGSQDSPAIGPSATAYPDAGCAFGSWSGASSGSVNPTSATMTSNKSLVANFAAIPIVSGPSSAAAPFLVSISFAWPNIVSSTDRYELECSHSVSSGFANLFTGDSNIRTSPLSVAVIPDATDIGRTVYLSSRAFSNSSYSPYSQVVAVSVPNLILSFYPNYDNTMIYNSTTASYGNTVYSTGDDYVGTSYYYNAFGLGGWSGSSLTFNNCPSYYSSYTATNGALYKPQLYMEV